MLQRRELGPGRGGTQQTNRLKTKPHWCKNTVINLTMLLCRVLRPGKPKECTCTIISKLVLDGTFHILSLALGLIVHITGFCVFFYHDNMRLTF